MPIEKNTNPNKFFITSVSISNESLDDNSKYIPPDNNIITKVEINKINIIRTINK
jgi:hypothetical protein